METIGATLPHPLVAALSDANAPAGLLPAREQMALSLGWHIVIACFGVAFPAMIAVAHWRGAYRGDDGALLLARRWSKVAGVLFAVGAVSGTVLSFELGILWPGLMGPFGDVLGLPFAFEGMSFFVEAIFLGMYLYGWGRLSPRLHVLLLAPMAAAGVFGTYCVLAVNAWMNDPRGFSIVDGRVTDVDPWAALTSGQAALQFAHMWVAAFMVVGFAVASVYAVGLLRGRRDRHHRLGFTIGFGFATAAALVQPLVGHVLGLRVADTQPAKLAAFELATTTESPSPLRIGGVLIDGEVRGAIDIPGLGSIIARNSLTEPVRGLDTIPAADQPPVNLTHLAFQSMIGIGTLLAALVAGYWLLRWRRRDLLDPAQRLHRPFLRLVAASGALAVVALEAGWIATEVGRQPWIVYGVLRTTDAAGDNPGLWWVYGASVLLYGGLTIGAVTVLRSMARRWRAGEEELPSPYGPDRESSDDGPRQPETVGAGR
ncbi:cytochrome ubiquinol oxidase subunit I [Nocardioides sp. TRM66260-LWL]|uniref:cytochrome ubiquinol oxidase subunit I n=1 Tax=Nocardioides sp. TRM66260-LWL TaxID=2874478 RepID=UPI001CC74E93|nr:cytochrome ubiquinol oxidase subunit I [Nocardioides sp. TRM66260-LWL]MBZ5736017.1 cytochrome ubiquinol oxidase subunit I [Nocardioides sp. TRM66260-LWL]